jgi:hypothetical protein
VFNLVIQGIGRVTVVFHDEGTDSHAIPYGMNGAVISFKISDTPIRDPKQLDRTELATKSSHTLYFDEKDRGKTAQKLCFWAWEFAQSANSTH